ncbi:hypothetical protein SFUMM280S_05081 [Streptomyces fumanus]
MSGTGPVEAGEGTLAHGPPPAPPGPPGRLARRRRTVLATAAALAVLAGVGYLYAGRPESRPDTPPPYPSQAVDLVYLDPVATPRTATAGPGFSFAVALSVRCSHRHRDPSRPALRRPLRGLVPGGTFPDKTAFRPPDHRHAAGDGMR